MNAEPKQQAALSRSIGLLGLVMYGIGDMVGAGVYGTTGAAARLLGNAVWMAFLGAMIAAVLTGLSYASIASRYPRAAGAAYVVQRAFSVPYLSYLIGLTVVFSGLTSIATGSRVFADTLLPIITPALANKSEWLWQTLPAVVAVLFVVGLTLLNFRGIKECLAANVVCTLVEAGGLIFVILVGMRFWGSVNYLEVPPTASSTGTVTAGLFLSGAVLTFYSFIGFEDLLNLAEETKNPKRTMPLGIVIALGVVTLLYIAVSITAVSVVHYTDLGDPSKGAAFAQIVAKAAPWAPAGLFTGITLFAVTNTALMNNIMGSRLIYGMANQGLLPRILGEVHPIRKTPHMAIATIGVVIVVLATLGNVSQLAKATSLLLLISFMVVNISLVVLKLRKGEPPGSFEIPIFIPILGMLVCGGLVAGKFLTDLQAKEAWITLGILALITALFFITRPKAQSLGSEEEA